MKNLRFQVDSLLATLLSQEYSSTEKALKELVDNAWDADAESVSITLPATTAKGIDPNRYSPFIRLNKYGAVRATWT